jgi:uncharacterized protein YhjY with autotransporter beta-barrel domain
MQIPLTPCAFRRRAASLGLALLFVLGGLPGALHPAHGVVGGGGAGNSTFTNSTTAGTTYTRVDLEPIQEYLTRVLGQFGNGTVVFDSSLNVMPSDPAVAAAIAQAQQALTNAGAQKILPPQLIASSTSLSTSVKTGEAFNHQEQSVSTTQSIGPGTILIGENQSETFFVVGGTTNFNTNTHTETFIDEFFQGTLTISNTFLVLGDPVVVGSGLVAVGIEDGELRVVDYAAVFSLSASGLPTALAQRQALLQMVGVAFRDVNGRLFRYRGDLRDFEDGAAGPSGDGKKEVAPVELAERRWEFFASGDYGYADQEDVGSLRGYEGNTWAATVGGEVRLTRNFVLGLAGTYVENHTDLGSGALGHLEIEGFAVSAYASYSTGHFYVDGLYGYGRYESDLRRRTLLGRTAHSDPESSAHRAELNTGYNFHLGHLATGPLLSLRYTHADLDAYTEHGGGRADAKVGEQKSDSLISELGWQASCAVLVSFGRVTFQARASWLHEYLSDDDRVKVGLVNSPFLLVSSSGVRRTGSFAVNGRPADLGDDYLSLGGGVCVDFGERVSVLADYEQHLFQNNRQESFVSLRGEFRF